MTSSSAYAAPLELDLRPGRLEVALRALLLLLALAAIALAALPLLLRGGLALLALLLVWRDGRRARTRAQALRLHANGTVECRPAGGDWQAARLVQAGWYLGLPQLQWQAGAGPAHACMLLPDRVDAAARQRLRVWLQTHAPQAEERAEA